MVARFVVTLRPELAPAEAWRRVFDLRQHSRIIPLTTVSGDHLDAESLREGSHFVGRTGVGRIAFDDPMSVDRWSPPRPDRGRCIIRKHGRWLGGWIEVIVAADRSGSRVRWEQEVTVPVPLAADICKPLIRAGYRWALRQLLAAAGDPGAQSGQVSRS